MKIYRLISYRLEFESYPIYILITEGYEEVMKIYRLISYRLEFESYPILFPNIVKNITQQSVTRLLLCRAVRGRELEISFLLSFSCLGEIILLHVYIVYCDTQLLVFRFSFLCDT